MSELKMRKILMSKQKIQLEGLFKDASEELRSRFNTIQRRLMHAPTKGNAEEDVWMEWIEQYLPKRYTINRGFVLDSKGYQSQQLDIIIFDRQYSPLIYKQCDTILVPIESVYAVIEVKTKISKTEMEDAGQKIASVRQLYRSPSQPVWHAGGKHAPKKHGYIYGYVVAISSSWQDKGLWENIKSNLPRSKDYFIDGGCIVNSGSFAANYKKQKITISNTESKDQALFGFLGVLFEDLKTIATVAPYNLGNYSSIIHKLRSVR